MSSYKTKRSIFKIPKLRKCLIILLLAWFSFMANYFFVLPACHRHLGFCPLRLCKFDMAQAIPVVYGLPMTDMLEDAKAGRIVLGGCMLGSAVAVCPHCRIGVKFRDWAAELKETE